MPKAAPNNAKTIWRWLATSLFGVVAAGMLIAYYVHKLPNATSSVFSKTSSVSFQQLAALASLAALTLIFLAFVRAKLFFSTRWLMAAVVYNILILYVKFTLSTNELIGHSKTLGSFLSIAVLISLLYIFAFGILYLFFDGKLLNRSQHKALIVSSEGKILLAIGLFICATLARIIIFRLPLLSGTSASTYLGDVFKTNTALLSGLLFVMCLAAVEAYAQVRRRADLKYFFVAGLVLILSFHLWWAIYMYKA